MAFDSLETYAGLEGKPLIEALLRDFPGKVALVSSFGAESAVLLHMAAEVDPKKSFWKDSVTYPFPVKYATAKDSSGLSWQIGYMDEYAGTDPDPQVLVLIHGKGAFAGHYGNIIKFAVQRGLRVIAPDLPHYGMSGTGNLDKTPARSLQDMRDVVHELVVNQLGVKQAF